MAWCLFSSCEGDIYTDDSSQVVIEGWIDNDGTAQVYVTRSMNVSTVYQEYKKAKEKYVVYDAEVTVHCDGASYRLPGVADSSSLVPFLYRNTHIPIRENAEYTLTVSLDGATYTAHTVMPEKVGIDTLYTIYEPEAERYRLMVRSHIRKGIFTRVFIRAYNGLSDFILVPMSGISGNDTDSDRVSLEITRPRLQHIDVSEHENYFREGENVTLRQSSMSEETYNFWTDFEQRLELSRNPMFPLTTNLTGNIPTVKGYWAAYNSDTKTVFFQKK